jgi:hypothetical protein
MAGGADVARYRLIEPRLWTTAAFRAMGPLKPSGQALWLYLLTGPRTTAFPGLVVARQGVIADDLGWTLDELRTVLAEPGVSLLLEADWGAGVVLILNAFYTQDGQPTETATPPSVNHVRGWLKGWSEIPESPLKYAYMKRLETFLEALGGGLGVALREGYPYPSSTQESGYRTQDKDLPAPPGAGFALSPPGSPDPGKRKAKPDRAAAVTPEAWKAADSLRSLILKAQPTNAIGREPWDPQKQTGRRFAWAVEFQKLFATDKRTTRELGEVLRWLFQAQTGDFQFVVHSPSALRSKWDRITAAMERDARAGGDNVIVFDEAKRKALEEKINASTRRQLNKTHTRPPPPAQPFSFVADDE